MIFNELGQTYYFIAAFAHQLAYSSRLFGYFLRHKVREPDVPNIMRGGDRFNDRRRKRDPAPAIDEFRALLGQDSKLLVFEVDQACSQPLQSDGVRGDQVTVGSETDY